MCHHILLPEPINFLLYDHWVSKAASSMMIGQALDLHHHWSLFRP